MKTGVMILDYSDSIAQTPGRRSTGEVVHADFTITKLVDAATPKLFEAACRGTHLPEVTIDLVHQGSPPFRYMEIKLKGVLISGVPHNANTRGDTKVPMETLHLTYAGI